MGLNLTKIDPSLRARIEKQIADENNSYAQSPVAQPIVRHEPVAAKERKGSDTKRFHVSVVSYRRRLCDADNLCVKYFVDCLRYAKIITDDSAKYITLQVEQQKVGAASEERTEIIIEPTQL